MSTRLALCAVAILVFVAQSPVARGCGFHDPTGVSSRRGMLNLSFPNALHVLGAVAMALRDGTLSRDTDLGDEGASPLAFYRTVARLEKMVRRLTPGGTTGGAPYSVLLIGPMLWTTVSPAARGPLVRTHADGRQETGGVIITDTIVVAALTAGRISGRAALERSLVRLYGTPGQVAGLTRMFVSAFPDPSPGD